MFDIRLNARPLHIHSAPRDGVSEEELDCEIAVLGQLCAELASTGRVDFLVRGFSEFPWPVSVSVDLCTFLEQLPSACQTIIHGGDEIEFDFYEQGIERRLNFKGLHAEVVTINCESSGLWVPSPKCEFITRQELIVLLVKFIRDLWSVSDVLCSSLVRHRQLEKFWLELNRFADSAFSSPQ